MHYNRVLRKVTVSKKELKKAFSSYWNYVEFVAEICVRLGIPVEVYLEWVKVSDYNSLSEVKEDEQKTVEKEV